MKAAEVSNALGVRTVRRRPANRIVAGGVSLAVHAVMLCVVIFSIQPRLAPPPGIPPAVPVELVRPPPPPPPPPKPKPKPEAARASAPPHTTAPPAPGKPPRAQIVAHMTPAPSEVVDTLSAGKVKGAPSNGVGSSDGVSEGELAGAAVAGSGGGGDACDMAARVQAALRKDPLVQAALASRGGRAIRLWNGDWVQTSGEDGRGLSAVREAILWEVGFSPKPCRTEPMRGLVLLTANSQPGAARLVVGASAWRWSDLLTPRGMR